MKAVLLAMALALLITGFAAGRKTQQLIGGGCDGCELLFAGMPAQLSWETTISVASEPGEPLEISGTIFKTDGQTPAAGVILYVYHTDASGVYKPGDKQTAARLHGRLRGWLKTNERGQYKFRTIKPGAYPGRRDPAHIHPTIKEPGKNEYYIDEYRFDDDPLLTREERAREEKRGGSGIIKLIKRNGVWLGRRDIILGLNIPHYR